MEVARARVHALVHKLKASCMLLNHISQKKELFSMHDVVRDVAILIASTEQNVFSATNEQVEGYREWSDESAIKLYTSIVLHDIRTNLLPEVVESPQLKLLFICADQESSSLTIPNKFFERMMQVRVINLTNINLMSLPSSLGLLSNLRTLSLDNCKLLDITVVRDLKKLEILCLRGSNIKMLPIEVSELARLRLLGLRDCRELEVIPANVLSNLSHLEELYIGYNSFGKWEVEMEGVKNASLHELKHLTSLELHIKDVNTLPRGLFFPKLQRYKIHIGGYYYAGVWRRELKICPDSKIRLKDGLIVQLQGIEDLGLSKLPEQDVDYFVNELAKVGPSQLKHLHIWNHPPNPAESKALRLCLQLRLYLKSRHLQCQQRREESTDVMQSHEIILEDNVNALFVEKVALPKLENLELDSINVERIWQSHVAVMSCGSQNLTHLTLYNCMNLRCLFSSSTVSNNTFVRLQRIEIENCRVLEELIVVENQEERKNSIVIFPQLQYLKMDDLEKLRNFCTGDVDILEFPSFKELIIIRCPEFLMRYKRTTNILTEKSSCQQRNSLTD
ncbi:uncharacterized protein LOC127902354 [Citrus sinensis]|uniref:uncharacterized protein LOC127902354 n=1 Tax=Citrus sinensis TaxID=2711 RepID=UPI002279727E|nr:uncharacterized protein LOC127902354 [Citrus sinensis]